LALIYLKLKESSSSNGSNNTGDPLGDIINDY
ncbi:MAG: PTS mannose/fructose/sorbose transporter subunit IIC, partial [Staphylococcus sp.]|nr:PTS mannose/fructose/sorbose transporter subunit IIC [Staphylococcus sp.]